MPASLYCIVIIETFTTDTREKLFAAPMFDWSKVVVRLSPHQLVIVQKP